MSKQWVIRKPISARINKVLSKEPELIRHLLFYKGIKTKKEADKFLNPNYERDMHDPFDILGMEDTVKRILKAIKNNERIVIFGDYDADGVCASAIFHDFFKKIGFDNFHIHIPDRHLDGYGLTSGAIDEFAKQKANLIITVDCGITDFEEVERANSSKIDVIITDHHLVPEKLPNALAVVDSKQKKDKYFFKYLSGAGVAFKIIQALVKRGNFNIITGWEKWLLDAVAIATIADMVPLVDENRTIAYYGLEVLKKTQRPGLISFYKKFNIDPNHITEDDIAFTIAPRINVASRLAHASTSFSLLITDSSGEANWISSHLDSLNNDRKNAVENILNEVVKVAAGRKDFFGDIIVVGSEKWHPGVLGIAANRILETYKKSVFMWGKAESNGIKGSCRSDGSVNLVELMKKLPKGILIEHGGHALAGGFSVEDSRMNDLEPEIKKAYKKIKKQKINNGEIFIDKELSLDDVNWENYKMIDRLRPFGVENPKPIFLFSDIEISNVRKFGNGGIHLELAFKKNNGENISAIGFFASEDNMNLKIGQKIDLAASFEKSVFRSALELRLRIVDIRIRIK